ncbi:MAG: hypothetical protein J3K34DRAFT_380622 [Monoraphidium minutum]|nr:MAG: hypothetical protein J3K34DRAFT_380622 [Monoraphidium minutum]
MSAAVAAPPAASSCNAAAAPAAGAAAADPRDAFACKDPHSVRVVDSHMAEALERDAALVVAAAVERHKQLKDVAQFVCAGLSKLHPSGARAADGVFHCVCGKSFASAVSHETRQYLHLKVDSVHVIVWKSKDSPFHAHDG